MVAYTGFGTADPGVIWATDSNNVSLGTRFNVNASGYYLTKFRIFWPAGHTPTNSVSLGLFAGGASGASGTVISGTTGTLTPVAGAWAEYSLPTPYLLTANTDYYAEYYTSGNGGYPAKANTFTSAVTSGVITFPANGTVKNGGYQYATGLSAVTNSFNATFYGIDIEVRNLTLTQPVETDTAWPVTFSRVANPIQAKKFSTGTATPASMSVQLDANATQNNTLLLVANSDATLTGPGAAGWTLDYSIVASNATYIWRKTAGVADNGAVTLTPSVADTINAWIAEYPGTLTPDVHNNSTRSSSATNTQSVTATGTTTQTYELVLAVLGMSGFDNTLHPTLPQWTYATNLVEDGTSANTAHNAGLFVGTNMALATGTRSESVTWTNNSTNGILLLQTYQTTWAGHSISVGQPVETDSTFVPTKVKSRTVTEPIETDTAFTVGKQKSKTVTQALETDSAFALGKVKSRSLNVVATETDTAQHVTAQKSHTVVQPVESDIALPVTVVKSRSIGIATEIDTAQAVTHSKAVRIGLATEVDTALLLPRSIKIGLAIDTSTAFPVSKAKARTIGQVTETDSALTPRVQKSRTIGIVLETDLPFAVAHQYRLISSLLSIGSIPDQKYEAAGAGTGKYTTPTGTTSGKYTASGTS